MSFIALCDNGPSEVSNLGDLTRNEVYCVILRRDYHIFLTVLNTFLANTIQYNAMYIKYGPCSRSYGEFATGRRHMGFDCQLNLSSWKIFN